MKPEFALSGAGLRPVTPHDRMNAIDLLRQPHVRRFLCDDKIVAEDEVAGLLERSEKLEAEGLGLWAIELDDRTFAGLVGLMPVSGAVAGMQPLAGQIEPVFALHPRFAGQGLATAALRQVLRHAESLPNHSLLAAAVDLPNQASHRLMRRCGFKECGRAAGPAHELVLYELAVHRTPDE